MVNKWSIGRLHVYSSLRYNNYIKLFDTFKQMYLIDLSSAHRRLILIYATICFLNM